MKHTFLSICCIVALVGLPMVTVAGDPPLDENEIGIEPGAITDDTFRNGTISVELADRLQSSNETPSALNNSYTNASEDTESGSDVGICVVGAGGPCN